MTSMVLYMNIALFVLGLGLIVVLFSRKQQDLVTLRITLFAYFLVILQYNYERIDLLSSKLLFTAAAACFVMWMWQTAVVPEESFQE